MCRQSLAHVGLQGGCCMRNHCLSVLTGQTYKCSFMKSSELGLEQHGMLESELAVSC